MESEKKSGEKIREMAVRIFDTVAHVALITAGFWAYNLFLSNHVGEVVSLISVIALWLLLAVCTAALVYLFFSIYKPEDRRRTFITRPLCTAGSGLAMEVIVLAMILIIGSFSWTVIRVMIVIALYFLLEFFSIFGHLKEKKPAEEKKKNVYVRRKR